MTKSELLKIAKPILFNTEMVQAILEGRKTVTRRAIKPMLRDDEYGFSVWYNEKTGNHVVEKYDEDEGSFCPTRYVNPRYHKGDILYVRETWCKNGTKYLYKAGCPNLQNNMYIKWKPSIHMPKKAARLFLKVTDVRVERLQDITAEQVRKEGFRDCLIDGNVFHSAGYCFMQTWNSTIKKQDLDRYGWEANPWVWVYEFEKVLVEI